jgi:hypothetical protein
MHASDVSVWCVRGVCGVAWWGGVWWGWVVGGWCVVQLRTTISDLTYDVLEVGFWFRLSLEVVSVLFSWGMR